MSPPHEIFAKISLLSRSCSIWDFSAPLSDMVALQRLMTDVLLPQLEVLTPGSGCYLNEVCLTQLITFNTCDSLINEEGSDKVLREIPFSEIGKKHSMG